MVDADQELPLVPIFALPYVAFPSARRITFIDYLPRTVIEEWRSGRIIVRTVRAWHWRKRFKLWVLLGQRRKLHADLLIGVAEMNARPGGKDYLAARERWSIHTSGCALI